MAALKTGKLPAAPDDRDLLFGTYVDLAQVLPKVPAQFGHERAITDWGMLGNGPDPEMGPSFQGAGDCVWTGAAHETMMWTKEAGAEATFNTHGVLADYGVVTGYDPTTGAHDDGTDVHKALNYRRHTGVVDAHGKRHKIVAYASLQPGNLDHLYAALYLFGVVGIGIRFPESAMEQFNDGKPWTPVSGAQIEGGHYIPLVAKRSGDLDCVTWGKVQPMSLAFLEEYCDEAYALLTAEDLAGRTDLEGFDLAQLQSDLKLVGGAPQN